MTIQRQSDLDWLGYEKLKQESFKWKSLCEKLQSAIHNYCYGEIKKSDIDCLKKSSVKYLHELEEAAYEARKMLNEG